MTQESKEVTEDEAPWEPLLVRCHPNSLQAKALNDPELAEKLRLGRLRQREDALAMEAWYRSGCT